MMALLNDINSTGKINRAELKTLLLLLNPFAPHITEEMYFNSFGEILNEQPWPEYDEKLCVEDTVEIVLQVNGRIKAKMNVVKDGDKEAVLSDALKDERIRESVDGKSIIKQIYVPNKLINFVVK